MPFARATRRLSSWIAILAVGLAALAPTISHALQDAASTAWLEVCSVDAPALPAGTAGKAPVSAPMAVFDHCPYCSLHALDGAPPPAPADLPVLAITAGAVPPLSLAAPHALPVWRSAQPRAPPRRA